MNECIKIWNVLHDGEITAAAQNGDVWTMFVSIPYLRRRLPPLGDSFVLTLTGVKRAEFQSFEGKSGLICDELDLGSPEILSTDSNSMPVTIETTSGRLILDFEGIRIALDTGETVEYETIRRICEEYWAEWKAKADESRRNLEK
jgi:hypothetical protein